MSRDVPLLEYVLGELSEEEAQTVERAVAGSPELELQLQTLRAGLDGLLDETPQVFAPPAGRDRLMAQTSGARRFLPFVDDLCRLFDLEFDAMLEVLQATERVSDWTAVGVPGVSAHHFRAGPGLAGADTGLVRFEAGARFPLHRHRGRELTYVLQGRFHFSTGQVLEPGDQVLLEGGEHEVWADDGTEVLYVTFHEGLDLK